MLNYAVKSMTLTNLPNLLYITKPNLRKVGQKIRKKAR